MLHARLIATLGAAACAALLIAACTAAPPKPAMVPLGQTGDFGYSERDIGPDRIEVTYTGSSIRVSSTEGRNDSRVSAENAKTRDLALWRAAQIADQRGMAAMRIETEARDTDLEVSHQYRSSSLYVLPHYYPFGYRHHYCCGPSWYYNDDYIIEPIPRAYSQSVTTLTILLLKTHDPNDATQLSVKETLARLQTSRSGAAY